MSRTPRFATRSRLPRDSENELYDRACDLVEAAALIRQRAADPSSAPAAPAVLGCIEAALFELSRASAALHASTAGPRATATGQRSARGLRNLETALADAEAAASAARSLAARALAER